MNEGNNFSLVPKMLAALEKAEPGTKRVLSGMVADTLALVKKHQRPKPRIVLVNDSSAMLELLESIVCEQFDVLTFQNGNQAWLELQRQDPHILVTDMQRPDDVMDGWKMIPLLAEKRVQYPVVIVSACNEFPTKSDLEVFGPEFAKMSETESAKFHSLLQHARQTLNILTLPVTFESEELLKLLGACLEMKDTHDAKQRVIEPKLQRSLGLCPKCESLVYESDLMFACEDSRCRFTVPKIVFGQSLDHAQMEKLLQTGKTDLLDNFISKDGKRFAAHLVLKAGTIAYEFPPRDGE